MIMAGATLLKQHAKGEAMESAKSLTRPTRLDYIYDVVREAGIDVSPWHAGKGHYRANPHYCYRWAFEGASSVVLCLWYYSLSEVHGVWTCSGNARQDQMAREAQGSDHWDPAVRKRTKSWAKSAYQMDEVMKQAHRNKNLAVRVCIVDAKESPEDLEASSADFRELDPVSWHLSYNMMTGDYHLIRGATTDPKAQPVPEDANSSLHAATPETSLAKIEDIVPEITESSYGVGVVDQFMSDRPDPILVDKWERERSAKVRQMAMLRSQGICEWCYKPGFMKHDGQVYLESHHVVPLSEGGNDHVSNVIALCPNDHRMAHYGVRREAMAQEMLVRIQNKLLRSHDS